MYGWSNFLIAIILIPFFKRSEVNGKLIGQVCPSLRNVDNLEILTQEQFVSRLTHSCRYDKFFKPKTVTPLPITIQMDLSRLEKVDQVQMKAYILVQYRYFDYRLKYSKISPSRDIILGHASLQNKIWIPHLIIRNERTARTVGINEKDVIISISPEGEIIFSYSMTTIFYCWMNLRKFPFDSQNCSLSLTSGTYDAHNLKLQWDKDFALKVDKDLHLTEFVIDESSTEEALTEGSLRHGQHGNFSELIIKFKLHREIGYYMMDYFLPSILLVCTSWVSFWLQADAGPPRATLGASTFLSFITLNGGLTKSLPKVSYIKASDIWFLACSCFIFGSLSEFAFVNVIWRRKKKVELRKQNVKSILRSALSPSFARKHFRKTKSVAMLYRTKTNNVQIDILPIENASTLELSTNRYKSVDEESNKDDPSSTFISITKDVQGPSWHTMTPREVAIWVDKKSRIAFPVAFIIFNCFYWTFVYVL